MSRKISLLLAAVVLCLLAGSAPRSVLAAPEGSSGGPYVLDWWTVDSGGGTSTGGIYSLQGTIGQPEAGRAACGPYRIGGGFWASPGRAGACWLSLPLISRGP
ncbi:MAG: hypothetical protein IT318_16825 [Anaerolineales bacterium]|nr:hypothetical protein [Anaerolineales bacterium]